MATLAIDGGEPVRTTPFPPRQPFGDREVELVTEAIRSQNLFGPSGTMTPALERQFAERYGVAHAAASTSGTAAIHTAIGALNPDPGDEIITAPITDAGSVLPILFQNCVPVFADVDDSYNIDPEDVAAKITPRTRAILAVHLFGNPCDVDALGEIARRHGVTVIEDCCQAHLTVTKGRLCGTLGTLGCFSFQQSKHMTCGDGGMTITDDPELGDRIERFRDKGWTRRPGARRYPFLGLNYRMTELQAAVALAQLEKVADVVARRNELGDLLTERRSFGRSAHPIDGCHGGREIAYAEGLCPHTERILSQMIVLTVHEHMSRGDVGDIAAAIRKVAEALASRRSGAPHGGTP